MVSPFVVAVGPTIAALGRFAAAPCVRPDAAV